MSGILSLKKNTVKMYSMGLLHRRFLNVVQDWLRVIKTKGSEPVSDEMKEVENAHHYMITALLE